MGKVLQLASFSYAEVKYSTGDIGYVSLKKYDIRSELWEAIDIEINGKSMTDLSS